MAFTTHNFSVKKVGGSKILMAIKRNMSNLPMNFAPLNIVPLEIKKKYPKLYIKVSNWIYIPYIQSFLEPSAVLFGLCLDEIGDEGHEESLMNDSIFSIMNFLQCVLPPYKNVA